jgi:hypothetical protein
MSHQAITIPILVDGTEKMAEFRFERTHVGPDGIDTYTWEYGTMCAWGYQVIDKAEIQHAESLGLFRLFYRVLGIVLMRKDPK